MSVRIYQLSKQVGMTNAELVELLRGRGYQVKSVSSTVDNISAEALVEEFGKSEEEEPASELKEEPVVEEPRKEEAPAPKLPQRVFVKSKEDVDRERRESREGTDWMPGLRRPPKPKIIPTIPIQRSPLGPVGKAPRSITAKPAKGLGPPLIRPGHPPTGGGAAPVGGPPKFRDRVEPKDPSIVSSVGTQEEAELEEEEAAVPKDLKRLQVKPPIVVRDFAGQLALKPFRLISELMELGIFASMNQVVEEQVARKIAVKHGFELEVRHRGEGQPEQLKKKDEKTEEDESKFLEPRPPVVCILGHVDHGKTTLLDTIRNTNVVDGEAGGITQHIGAYQIEHNDQKITFIDTPGHAAFTKMRARGAHTTDIAVLIVAADDGFMPQTDEALGYAESGGIPLIIAINKIDTKGVDIDKVKRQMQERNIAAEDWGGQTLTVSISALQGENISDLLDTILLQTEIMEGLEANPDRPAEGIVVEAQKEVGRGNTASLIVQKGTLKRGDALVCGIHHCKVRAMMDDSGRAVKSAPPSMPVRVVGWSGTPESGAKFKALANEKIAKAEAEENLVAQRRESSEEQLGDEESSLQGLFSAIAKTRKKVFRVVVKADVFGTAEALGNSLEAIKSDKIELQIVQTAVGLISKKDVLMASASEAAIVGFNVNMEHGVSGEAKHRGIAIYLHDIIYEIIDIVKDAMADTLEPELIENKVGAAEVRQIFPIGRSIRVAGCLVTEGRMVRESSARVLREGAVEAESKIETIKRFKEDATEVRAGYECGVQLDDFDAYEEGDVIECFEINKVRPSL